METADAKEMEEYAARFAVRMNPRPEAATVVTLSGVLGAGKTTFVQAVAKALGVQENVTSPSFVIEKTYPLRGQKFATLVHIDAYRLESGHELEVLGFGELLRDPTNLIFIEWPEKIPLLIPKNAVKIRFDIAGERRIITSDGQGKEGKN